MIAFSIEYNQRNWVELEASRRVIRDLHDAGYPIAAQKTVTMGPPGTGMGSLLTAIRGRRPIDSDAAAVVPGRNIMFLTYAAAFAAAKGAARVVIGCNADDAAGFPDCRLATLAPLGEALAAGLDWDGAVVAPLLDMTKTQAAATAVALGIEKALGASWSCYQPVQQGHGRRCNDVKPCGTCPACTKRAAAFAAAGLEE